MTRTSKVFLSALLMAMLLTLAVIFTPRIQAATTVISGSCGTGVSYSLNSDGLLTISGSGKMTDWASTADIPWYSNRASIKNVIIGQGVTSIGSAAFYNCSNLTYLTLMSDLESIGYLSFYGCTSLANVTIPSSVTSIGDQAFRGCSGLTTAVFSPGMTSIGKATFYDCTNLVNVTLPSTLTDIGEHAFYNCKKLSSINLPTTVTKISKFAFFNCTSLSSAIVRSGVTEIQDYALGYYYSNSTYVVNPDFKIYGYAGSVASTYATDKGVSFVTVVDHTVKYNSNGGSPTPGQQTKVYGIPLTLSTTEPGRTGYIFKGWSTSNDQTVDHASGSVYYTEADLTLYAVWEAKKYIISYDANGGTDAPAPQIKLHGVSINLTTDVPEWPGHIFKGWATTSTGSVAYNSGATYTPNEAKTLYAVWESVATAMITYDANGGAPTPSPHDVSQPITSEKPALTGYTFKGWSTIRDGSVEYTSSASHSISTNTILYAVWQANKYTVTFNANGGTNAPAPQTKTHDDVLILTTDKPIRSGYTFKGWSTTESGNAVFFPGGEFNINAHTTLYAVWQLDTAEYTVTYNANGGTNAPDPQIKIQGVPLILTSQKPTYTGYTFMGWSTTVNGNVEYGSGSTYEGDEDITLYAVWDEEASPCGDNLYWAFDTSTKTLTVKGTGNMWNYTSSSPAPWKQYASSIQNVVIESGAESIGNRAFMSCTGIKTVLISDSVKTIGSYAFMGCSSMTDITFGTGITSVGANTFTSCSALSKVHVTDFDSWCGIEFATATANPISVARSFYLSGELVNEAEISNSVTAIKAHTFRACNLKKLTIYSSVTEIASGAFSYCPNLVLYCEGGSFAEQYAMDNNIPLVSFGECGTGLKWYYNHQTNILEIIGKGSIKNYTNTAVAPWTEFSDEIESIVLDHGVTSIGDQAFLACRALKTVELASTVTKIGRKAFASCSSLETIVIPDFVTEIGAYAFLSCTSLTEVTLGNSLELIDQFAFSSCDSLKKVHVSHVDVLCGTNFANYAANPLYKARSIYVNGEKITECEVSDGVRKISAHAFRAVNLTKMVIPATVTSIGTGTFAYCSDLTIYGYEGSHAEKYSRENSIPFVIIEPTATGTCGGELVWRYYEESSLLTISGTGDMANYTSSTLAPWTDYADNIKTVCVFDGVTSIGTRAFRNLKALTNAVLSDTITKLGGYAFLDCSALTDIAIGTGLVSSGTNAFSRCTALEKVHITDFDAWCGIEFVNAAANPISTAKTFYVNGKPVYEVEISDGVASIGAYAFRASTLTKIKVPASVTTIGAGAFGYCTSLVLYVSVNTTAEDYAAENGIPYIVSGTCGDNAEWFYSSRTKELLISGTGAMTNYSAASPSPWNAYASVIDSLVISEGITTIGNRAFSKHSAVKNVILPDSITTIGTYAFYGCSILQDISIGTGLKNVGTYAFYTCPEIKRVRIKSFDLWCGITFGNAHANPVSVTKCFYLNGEHVTEVEISDGVTSIGANTFRASDIEKMIVPPSVTTIGTGALSYCTNLVLYVTSGSFAETYAKENDIPYVVFGSCGPNATWRYIERTNKLFISGTGAMDNFTPANPAPWSNYTSEIKSIYVEEGITNVGNRAFLSCSSAVYVSIPDSVSRIGGYAFTNCTSLTEISIGSGVQSIGTNCFSNCSALKRVHVADFDSWSRIDFASATANPVATAKTFYHEGERVTEITLTDAVTSISSHAYRASNITRINIPRSVTSIGAGAFSYCTQLTIYGYVGSEAERYANANSIPFVNIITEGVKVSGTGLVLDGSIGLKLYFTLLPEYIEATQVNVTVYDKQTKQTVSENTYVAANGLDYDIEKSLYNTVVSIPPKDVDNIEVRVTLFYDNEPLSNKTFTIPAHIADFKTLAQQQPLSQYGKALPLVESLEVYANYADNYFGNASALPELTVDTTELDSVENPSKTGSISKVKHLGTSLVIEGKTIIRHYFEITRSVTKLTFELDGVKIKPVRKAENIYYVDIADIPAHELSRVYTLTINLDTSATIEMKYCGLNYIQSAITLEDAKMRNLSKALYEYYRQAYLYVNNIVLVRGYQIIDDSIYYYGNDGNIVKDTTVDGYTFGSDGKLVANNKFVTVNGNTYYLVNNKIVHGYRVVGNYIYYFGEDGAMVVSTTVDGYTFGADGKLVGNGIYVTVRGKKYYMKSNKAYLTANVFGTVTESDNDADYSNNDTLRNVKCTAVTNAGTFTCYSDSYGEFDFGDLPLAGASIKFELSGYITATLTSDINVTPLRIVMDKEVSNKLSGKIFIADSDTDYTNNSPLSGAKITLERETSTNIFVKTATSDSNGNYYFEGLTAGVYKLTVEKSGYITVSQTVNVRYNESNIQNLAIEAIADTQVADGYASGYVTDAKTGSKIQGITVYIREGINNTTGNVLCTSTTNSSGLYKTVALAPGNYTAQFVDNRPLSDEDNRYGTVSIAIKVLSNITVANQNSTMSNNAGISAAGMQVVLTWGSNPSDLDSHLFAKLADGSSYHIYYSHKVESDANLDVDDTSYYGPETVTVSDFSNGIYSYYVHDYSNRGNSYNTVLSNSGATVKVYIDSANTPSYTFYVPQGSGTYWHVFDYNYTTGEFIPVNRITNSAS